VLAPAQGAHKTLSIISETILAAVTPFLQAIGEFQLIQVCTQAEVCCCSSSREQRMALSPLAPWLAIP